MKKYKIKFGVLIGLLLCVVVQCIAFSVYAAEIEVTRNYTNIVAVVDCSSSMQASDSNWKVPESLYMLVDMCPSEDIRLSMVVYGTDAQIVFRDMPLSEENHSGVKQQIKAALVNTGYTRGQTDTGAALGLAQGILEEQKGQNNMVLLFTDGAVLATKNGRSTEQSRGEIDSFAVFCQNNGVVVNTLGLFSSRADPEEVERAAAELAILKDKTGGEYQRVENAGDIPEFVVKLLSSTLNVLPLQLNDAQAITAKGYKGWQYSFSITDTYSNDVTFVLPNVGEAVTGVMLQNNDGEILPVEEWLGASWVQYTRYNGKPGYSVVTLKHLEQQPWVGEYTLMLLTDAQAAPELTAFFLYDVTVHVELDQAQVGVLQPVNVNVYLTDSNGYRIDDADFLNSLQVDLEVVNLTNMGAEVTQSATGSEDRTDFDQVDEKMQLFNDSFRFLFTPQRASEYQLTVRVSNDRFTRRIRTQPLQVQDQLQIESSVLTPTPHKNSPLEVRAYLVQQSDHRKVQNAEFYRLCGATTTFTNTDTGMVEVMEMEALEDGNGLAVSFVPKDEGSYTVVVSTNSSRELVERVGQEMSFQVVDRPIRRRSSETVSYGLLQSFVQGYNSAQTELIFSGNDFFYDPDGDSYRLQCEALSGNGSEMVYDNAVHYQPSGSETLRLRLTALDYSGNSISMELSVRILSVFEVIVLTVGIGLVVLLLLVVIIYLAWSKYCADNELRGMMVMEVNLNGQLPQLLNFENEQNAYYDMPLPRYYIPLVNPENVENDRHLLKTSLGFWEKLRPRELYLGRLLGNYAENYCASGYGMNAVYIYLRAVADDLISDEENKQNPCSLQGQQRGTCFSLQNISSRPVHDQIFVTERGGIRRKLRKCQVGMQVTNTLNNRLENSTGLHVCGLQFQLYYLPEEPLSAQKVKSKKERYKRRKNNLQKHSAQ